MIHSLNGRDNGILTWLFQHADQDANKFRRLVEAELASLQDVLQPEGVLYSDLKAALTPSRKGKQIVLLYDWKGDTSANYAVAFEERWLPLLRKTAKFTSKSGDLLDLPAEVFELDVAVVRARQEDIMWNTIYAVYFSNVSDEDVASIHNGLLALPRYKGYLDITLQSEIRDYVAGCLTFSKIFIGMTVVLDHGGDEPIVGSEDPLGFPYGDYGYRLVSVIDTYFYPFLDYKIESFGRAQVTLDSVLSLAVATGELIDLNTVSVHVPQEKLDKYLLRDESKLALMTSAGLQNVTPKVMADLIRDRLLDNYIYAMKSAADGTDTFAVMGEFEKPDGALTKRLLALKYDSDEERIALVTMY